MMEFRFDRDGNKINNLCVCARCKMAIESHEGVHPTITHYFDDDYYGTCDWCEMDDFEELYEFI